MVSELYNSGENYVKHFILEILYCQISEYT